MTRHDGATPAGGRRAVVRDREDAVLARLQQLAADLDDAPDPRFRAATRDRLAAMAAVRAPQPARRPACAGCGPPVPTAALRRPGPPGWPPAWPVRR